LLNIRDQMAADVVPGLLGQRVGDLMKISKRLGFVAHRRLGVPLVLSNGDHYKSRQNRIEDADDGKFESRRFFVEAEAIGASLPATGGIRPML
jgi:hypothetical protein